MQRLLRIACSAAVAVLAASTASAQPVAAGIGAFSGATVVNFNSTVDETFVGSQYNALGVTFSGALYGMTGIGDRVLFPNRGGGVIASNWLNSQNRHTGLSFTALFSGPVTSAGFWLENYPIQTGTVEVFNNSVSLGRIAFAPTVGLQAEFWGLTSALAFNELTFTNTISTRGFSNGFYAIDDFQFGAAAVAVAPEPASILLMSTGLLGIVGLSRRRSSV